MPITLFGRAVGAPRSARAKVGFGRQSTLIGRNSTASRAASQNTQSKAPTKQVGRTGANAQANSNAGARVFVPINGGTGSGGTATVPLPDDGDFVQVGFQLTGSAVGLTASTDLLNALTLVEIIAPDGPIFDAVPNPDFYMLFQRFSEYGRTITATNIASTATTTSTVSASATYLIPMNLPAAKGPYTMLLTAAAGYTVTGNLTMVIGTCPNGIRTRFKGQQGFPYTIAGSTTFDFAPLASIQDVELEELFISGQTSNTTDINYIQVQSQGSTIGPKVYATDLQASDQQVLTGTLITGDLYPLLALHTSVTLGRSAHFYITYGATPLTTALVGYYWYD